ncbi:MAG: P63C domain-containing protein [Acidobacteriota bacterium]
MEDRNQQGTIDGRVRSGKARMDRLSPEERKQLARDAAMERWRRAKARQVAKDSGIMLPGEMQPSEEAIAEALPNVPINLPIAKWPGQLAIGIPVYVLNDQRRIISRTGATDFLTDRKGGGNLESYIGVQALQKYMPHDLPGMMVEFVLPEVVNKTVKGMEAETFVDICQAYISAWRAGDLQSDSQINIAGRASMFLAACAKIGIIALIDEATGFQYERPLDALQVKLKLFLAEEMRKWEKTFPDELWEHFGRLTGWKGGVNSRPKYWGKLVMELVYEYLDPDVAEWLRQNAPKPLHGKNYHQWMNEQYGLKKLIEHIWKLIGVASACDTMDELRYKMEQIYGKKPGFQFELKLAPQEEFRA